MAEESLGCTALAVDGGASINGAAFAVENTDCNNCDFRLNHRAAREYPVGAQRAVYMNPVAYPRFVGHGRGEIYNPVNGQNVSVPVSYIPEVRRTFGYYESVSPLMNDAGLGIGESSCGAMLQNKPPGSKEDRVTPVGVLDAMTLMQLALERCATARCAVDLIGELSEEYGYLPYGGEPSQQVVYSNGKMTFADSGEAYTLADASGEAWMLNVVGGVEGIVKSVWAAQKIPKGHFAVVANEFTMGEIPSSPTNDFRYSKDIFRAAKAAGLWDGKGALVWNEVFAPDPTLYGMGTTAPIPMYSSLRRWRLMNIAAPSLDLKLELDHRKYPFSVKVERPLSHRDIMAMMRDHYVGTEFDMTQGILAGPYGSPFRPEGGPKLIGDQPRGISIFRTLYSTITQSGPNGSVVWYAADTPASSVYIPLDSRSDGGVSSTYASGHNREFDRSTAWWIFNFVNNWMQLNYQGMSTEDVLPRMEAWQERFDQELQKHDHADAQELRSWQVDLQERLVADWQSLADFLIMKWIDMRRSSGDVTAGAVGYTDNWAKMIGYSYDVHPIWVKPAETPGEVPWAGYVAPTVSLPRFFNFTSVSWAGWTEVPGGTSSLANAPQAMLLGPWIYQVITAVCLVSVGFIAGRRRRPDHSTESQPYFVL